MRQLLDFKKDDGSGWGWFFMNDSDSVCLDAKFPDYLYEEEDVIWSNLVDDFRKDMPEFGPNYHGGFPFQNVPMIASQPPYFCSRYALEKLVNSYGSVRMCPVTPFIDWLFCQMAIVAGVELKPFLTGASCETKTDLGIAVMRQQVSERGATFVHAIKTERARDMCIAARKEYLSRQ